MTTRKNTQMNVGGLMRCCIESARQWATAKPDEPVAEGDTVRCLYEKNQDSPRMIVKNGVLQWNNEPWVSEASAGPGG